MATFWTTELADQAFALRAQGLTETQIGEQMGRSKGAINSLFRRVKQNKAIGRAHVWTAEELATLTAMRDAPVRDIMAALGKSETVVRGKLQVVFGPRVPLADRIKRGLKAQIEQRFEAGDSNEAIARRLGASRAYVDFIVGLYRPNRQETEAAQARKAEDLHLSAIRRELGDFRGFPVVSDFLMRRLAQLEWAPRPKVLFA